MNIKHINVVRGFTFAVLLLALSPALRAQGDVNAKLTGFEWRVEAFEWSDTEAADLAKLASNDSMALFMRKRALLALGQIEGELAEQQLLSLAQVSEGRSNPPSLQRRAVDIVCTRIPTSENRQTILDVLIGVSASENEHLRHRAAVCLQDYQSTATVEAALVQYRSVASAWELLELNER